MFICPPYKSDRTNIKNSSELFPTVSRSAVPRSAVPCSLLASILCSQLK
ncbi:MAG: hypothetical protein F6J98_39735 [Moorea sp. SIO4G2]|nr:MULTISPECIES: hypothetical protein [unclassified Moorena]NEO66190.1 hypothetical protein [Moorena sp. SIO4G2]NEP29028.1 hypothetical protein [Moorena sp. SIO3I6]NEQ03585.1 hypothetical protein [Moorena sp. SIO3F7]